MKVVPFPSKKQAELISAELLSKIQKHKKNTKWLVERCLVPYVDCGVFVKNYQYNIVMRNGSASTNMWISEDEIHELHKPEDALLCLLSEFQDDYTKFWIENNML